MLCDLKFSKNVTKGIFFTDFTLFQTLVITKKEIYIKHLVPLWPIFEGPDLFIMN